MVHFVLKALYLLPQNLRKKLVDYIGKQFIKRYARLKVKGLDGIPSGPVIFVSNHLSNADGLILREVLTKKEPVFLAGVKLSKDLITNLFLEIVPHIAINPNQADRTAIKESISTLENGKSIFIFPEGTRSRTGKMIKGRSGVLLVARKANVPIVPIGLQGTEKLLPIKDGQMGKEWFNESEVVVNIGKPFLLEDITEENTIDGLMLRIAELVSAEYRGEYDKPVT